MLADKKPGAFELEILSMEVIRAAESALDDRPAAKQLMMSAIDGGVPLFNRGDAQGCAELYAFALGKSMEMDGLTAGEQSLIADALTDAARLRATDAAWTLRYAMDSILRSP